MARLQERRKKLESLLEDVQLKIAAIEGRVQRGQRRASAARTGAPAPQRRRRRRTRKGGPGGQALDKVVVAVLSETPGGLPLKELEQAVLDRGYKTSAKNFRNVLYQAVYKLGRAGKVKRDPETGRYKLVG
ncbi:MAG: hypothetical protein D6725_06485 [Planctomycetota bacterium]|nr:MAG: hypothetical protein D6725_06485 [Planctomycetota bacterium]